MGVPNHCGGRRKVPTMSEVLSSIQSIYFRKTSGSNMGEGKFACYQWGAEVWWCPGRLPKCMPLYQILVLNCGVWWSLLVNLRCLWRHIMTSYSRLQPKILVKSVESACILFHTHSFVRCCTTGFQTRGPHVACKGILCSPRCFCGIFKYCN